MKTKILSIGLILILGISLNNSNAQNVFIPDANFRAFLNATYPTFMDASGDSLIPDSAATLTGTLDCNSQNIAGLTGIECFININYLNCYNNQLTALPDLSANTDLQYIWCNNNQLTALPDLTANTALQILYCYNNQLTALPVLSANTDLQYLWCYNNQLTALPDLSTNIALQQLRCQNNQLTALPVLSTNTALQYLWCYNNQLTALPDLSANIALQQLHCYTNQLTALPVLSANTALLYLYCGSNQLTTLPDLSANTALQELLCDNNKLDFSDARELRIADTLSSLTNYGYSPQNPFGVSDILNLCAGNTAVLSIASQDSALSYQWFKGTNTITGATDTLLIIPNITTADAGVYTCKSYGIALLSPPMNFGPGISEFVSEPITVNVNDSTSSTIAETSCDSYTSPSGNYIWTTTGIYYDTIPNVAGCDSLMTIDLTVNIVDTSVTQNGIMLTANTSGATYQWLDCNDAYSVILGETNQSFTATVNGNYAVEITENACIDTSSCYAIISVSINEEKLSNNIAIYPNPTTGIITIQGNNIELIEVRDIQGQLISRFDVVPEKFNIDLSKQSKAVYFLTIKTGKKTVIKKVILE